MNYNFLELKCMKEDFCLNATLKNLGDINYFAGESNSGKSLLLDTIYTTKENVATIKDSPNLAEFWDEELEDWASLVNKHMVILDVLDYRQASTEAIYSQVIEELGIIIKEFGHYEETMINQGKNADPKGAATSSKKIYNLIFWIVYLNLKDQVEQFVIDEPECHLHPYITKTIPLLLEYLANRYGIQFFVATHSPFILSAVARITYEETSIKQTVYFLKDGELIDKYGEVSDSASSGYWGQKLIPVANAVLGSGIEDLFIEQAVEPDKDAPTLILCEGEHSDQDALIYNTIFHDISPSCLFVSCKGSSQLYRSFQLLNEVKPGLSGNFRIFMIRDRDAEFPDKQAVDRWEQDHPNAKILTKRAMECYLFNSETAKALNQKYNQVSDANKLQDLDVLLERIAKEVRDGQKTSDYKESLAIAMNRATNFILDNKVGPDHHYMALSKLIKPEFECYKQLFEDIFK
jgi:AAA domain, putative AbiEii toxin, Type IV TA system